MKQYLARFGPYFALVAFCVYKFVTSAQRALAISDKNMDNFSDAAFKATNHAGDVMLFWMAAMFAVILFGGLLIIIFAPWVQADDYEDEPEPDPKAPMDAPWDESRAA